ncbi:type II toxin-antitoxin system RelE/ParE family toxin [Patescibacteria group bacterium]|nr:type II toxin-antitoxin system RelE/ParE family toxin [Patescibacteria group bacterium]
MAYKLFYTKSAFRNIQKLDPVVRKKIKKKIEAYSKKPLFYARKLIKPVIGTYRWRVGNYRVVFDIDKKNIVILRIGHRREIYR